jgi:hypothetical protein
LFESVSCRAFWRILPCCRERLNARALVLDDGCMPTPEQHALGGYETWAATSSFLEVEASRKITSTLVEMLAGVSKTP